MKINNEFKFDVSLSIDTYVNKEISNAMIGTSKDITNREIRKKYGFKSNVGIGYKRCTVTIEELYNALTTGRVMCNLFDAKAYRKDGTFGSSQKNDDNFIGSYVIGVDIDHTNYSSASEFVGTLSLKPSFYYTSYSNLQPDKGARFRLIYVLDEVITNKYVFRYVANKINTIIEADTKEVIDDKCNLRCTQYFNGTNKNNKDIIFESGFSGLIYSSDDFGCNDNDLISFLDNNCLFKSKSKKILEDIKNLKKNLINNSTNSNISTTYYNETEKKESPQNEVIESEKSLFDERLLNDMVRLSYDEFMKYNRHKFHYFWRAEKKEWINGLYQYVDDDYFAFPYSFGAGAITHDGQHRRKKVFMRMCLRRVMNPNADANTILFNAYEDIHRFFDFSGIDLEDYLKINIEFCFDRTIEDINEDYSEIISNLKETTKPKRGIIYKNRKAHSKETTYLILDEYYNKDLSVNDNLTIINELGYIINKTTIYEYINARNIKTTSSRLTDDEILNLIDWNLSATLNYQILKDSDIKISKDRLYKLYKNNKEQYKSNILHTTTTYYNKTEKKEFEVNQNIINENLVMCEDTLYNTNPFGESNKIQKIENYEMILDTLYNDGECDLSFNEVALNYNGYYTD